MKSIIIDNITFEQKKVVLPVSAFKGSKTNYLGFDATIFKNRNINYDPDVNIKKQKIKAFLKKTFKEVDVLSSESYYIKDNDLYIDLRLDYKHNFNAYNKSNKFHISCLNELIEKEDKDIIRQWCIVDPEIRLKMIKENKKYLEIFNYDNDDDLRNQINRVYDVRRKFTECELRKELLTIIKSKGNYSSTPTHNKIVAHFNPHIYTNENEFYKNPIDRRQHIENCRFLQYKMEHELSDSDILINFRFNKYITYYSYFSPLWAKKFIEDYQPGKILDPFGGWGHRYLAFLDLPYIYNDLWKKTYDGVCKIDEFCRKQISLPYKKLLNEDAGTFKFNEMGEGYDCIYTCGPYFNFEKYDGKIYGSYQEFLELWEATVKNCICPTLQIFAFVIKSNFSKDCIGICEKYGLKLDKEILLGRNIQHHYNRLKGEKIREYIYVMTTNKYVKKTNGLFD